MSETTSGRRYTTTQLEQHLRGLVLAIREADKKAIRRENTETGDVAFYTLPTGPWHRLLGLIATIDLPPEHVVSDGRALPVCWCGEIHMPHMGREGAP